MTGEPREPKRPAASERPSSHLSPDPGAPSPWRALFAVIPMLVIVAVATSLIGSWDFSPREEDAEPPSEAAPHPPDTPVANRSAAPDTELAAGLLADGDPEAGARVFRMCMPCHFGEKGAGHKIGPTLWNVVGRDKAGDATFTYSAALRAKEGAWTYGELAAFLRNPRAFAPGTSMAFAGLSDPRRLADLLAYMRTLSDTPAPLPD